MIILDTNVVSEIMRGRGHQLEDWVIELPASDVFTTAVTVAEVRFGIERLPEGKRKQHLHDQALEAFAAIASRVLPFDGQAGARCGELMAQAMRHRRSFSFPDAQIAAITACKRATLATRNIRDFETAGIDLVNPFELT